LTFEEAAKGVKKTMRLRDAPTFDVDIPAGEITPAEKYVEPKLCVLSTAQGECREISVSSRVLGFEDCTITRGDPGGIRALEIKMPSRVGLGFKP
jgi:hypothetical protein